MALGLEEAVLTNQIPGHLLVFLDAADIRELQQGVNVVWVELKQDLWGHVITMGYGSPEEPFWPFKFHSCKNVM